MLSRSDAADVCALHQPEHPLCTNIPALLNVEPSIHRHNCNGEVVRVVVHAEVYAASNDSVHEVLCAVAELDAASCVSVVKCDYASGQETAYLGS